MTPQQHADHLLQIYQQRRAMSPALRLVDAPPLAPVPDADEYERDLDVLRAVLGRA